MDCSIGSAAFKRAGFFEYPGHALPTGSGSARAAVYGLGKGGMQKTKE
jgi:hypothetical protein